MEIAGSFRQVLTWRGNDIYNSQPVYAKFAIYQGRKEDLCQLHCNGGIILQVSAAERVKDALALTFSDLDAWFERPLGELELRPGYPGAWSCLEHLEHIGLVNHFLLLTIRKGCAKALKRAGHEPAPEGQSELAPLFPIADPDAFPWPPPSHMLPAGGREPAQLRALLRSQGSTCLELLAGMPRGEGRLCTVRMSVQGLGRLDMYQWLFFLAQHGRYHLALLGRRRVG
jgi:hypothetical protein